MKRITVTLTEDQAWEVNNALNHWLDTSEGVAISPERQAFIKRLMARLAKAKS